MAAITDLQVESRASSQASLLWTDNGEANTLKRALHGGSYSTVATVTGTASYTDTTITAGVYYDYKITSGVSGDSNVVSVTVQVCDASPTVSTSPMSSVGIPRAGESGVDPALFNLFADQVEAALQPANDPNTPMIVCPTNGAIIIDCRLARNFTVQATTDINSISMIGCNNAPAGNVSIQIPPNVTRKIAGFPLGFGMTPGQVSVSGGTTGKTYSFPFSNTPTGPLGSMVGAGSPGVGGAGGGGGGGGGCGCSPSDGQSLTITCCTASCSMSCSGGKSLSITVCGGVPPYSYSVTGSLTAKKTSGSSATITPPANTGSGVAGDASREVYFSRAGSSTDQNARLHGCNDQVTSACSMEATSAGTPCRALGFAVDELCTGSPAAAPGTICPVSSSCTDLYFWTCDTRTAGMIAAGCKPCRLMSAGQVVTVTDSLGTSVSKTITS